MIKKKQTLAGLMATVTVVTTLSGCSGSSILREDVTKYALPPALTVNEAREYYTKSLDFDSVITKNIDVDVTNYEVRNVSPGSDLEKKLNNATSKSIQLLHKMEYDYEDSDNEDGGRYLPESVFHYIKSYLNDTTIEPQSGVKMTEALGFYFVDVPFTVKSRNPGSFTGISSLLGLNGAIHRNFITDTDEIDTRYLEAAAKKLNEYYETNRLTNKKASFNSSTYVFSTEAGAENNTTVDFTQTTATDNSEVSDSENENSVPVGSGQVVSVDSGILGLRSPKIDISEFHSVVGSTLKNTAYMPKLDLVYNIPGAEGSNTSISGIGIFPSGIGGLKTFSFNREELKGEVTLRFVYKDDLDHPGMLLCTNIYPRNSLITTGISSNDDSNVAEFLIDTFNTLIERADRAVVNCDMSALMNGKIFGDMGKAVLTGYEHNYVNVLRQISTVRRVVKRNIETNTYLVEVETFRQEGPKGAESYGTYLDSAYVAIQQEGTEFVITDWLTYQRLIKTEPDIDPDSVTLKRLVALNIANEVPEEAKTAATYLLNDLYISGTYRWLSGTNEFNTTDGVITLTKGLEDCFNTNPELLSTVKYDSFLSGIRAKLTKYTAAVEAQMNGRVYEWIGGTDKQVELLTEELITYTGRDDGLYMKCYYLISRLEDVWVIDDLQIIDLEEISGTELSTIKDRIGKVDIALSNQNKTQQNISQETQISEDNSEDTED